MTDTVQLDRTAHEPAADNVLEVRGVTVEFASSRGRTVRAVDDVSFEIERHTTFGLIGESGSGKSTLARRIVGLLSGAGEVVLDGQHYAPTKRGRRRVQMVVQDPHASFDPRMRVGASVAEPMRVAGVSSRSEREERVLEMFERVGLRAAHAQRYPHEMSGGQKQRASIARALVAEPDLLVCDESLSSLDVALQAEMLNLLSELRTSFGLSILFISHDLGVVSHIADRVGVMYLGRLVEVGTADEVIAAYRHPYTKALIESRPLLSNAGRAEPRTHLQGEIPSAYNPPSGCHFRSRCRWAQERCAIERPALTGVPAGSSAACHFADELSTTWHVLDEHLSPEPT